MLLSFLTFPFIVSKIPFVYFFLQLLDMAQPNHLRTEHLKTRKLEHKEKLNKANQGNLANQILSGCLIFRLTRTRTISAYPLHSINHMDVSSMDCIGTKGPILGSGLTQLISGPMEARASHRAMDRHLDHLLDPHRPAGESPLLTFSSMY